jgi:hypothetical protein
MDTPAWVTDYGAARKQGASAKKPLVVVLSSGANSWQKLSREGALSSEALKAFKDKYICIFINTATEEGKNLATAFDIPSGLGIVISDRTGDLQAFRHEGDLANADLVRYLDRYGDPNYVVLQTESNPGRHGGGYGAYGGCGGGGGCGGMIGSCGGGCGSQSMGCGSSCGRGGRHHRGGRGCR